MLSSRILVRILVVAGLVADVMATAGCSSHEAPTEKEDVGSNESELRLGNPRYLGRIANGETKTNEYYAPPTFRAYGFDANGGDEITADVKSANGDAMAWITSSTFDVLAANDDAAPQTLDAKAVYKVPAGAASRAYRIVFRDYDKRDATFTVKLTVKAAAPVMCSYVGQTFNAGTSFPSTDGCNTCTCGPTGGVGCTKVACACNPDNEPFRNYVGTLTACETIRYSCKATQRSFQNACGCGCENLLQ